MRMSKTDCRFERFANIVIGLVTLLFGLGFVVIGATILPVIGLFIALPLIVLSALFLIARRSPECLLPG